jgi:hypothetical protein
VTVVTLHCGAFIIDSATPTSTPNLKKHPLDNEWWKIATVYSKEMRKTTRRVENTMKMDREECMLLGGDFNGRIGERGARNWEEEKGDGRRKTKDKVENAEGKKSG